MEGVVCMWFKNIHFYRFEEDFKLTSQQLHEQLTRFRARDCGQMEMACQGWEKPLGRSGQLLVHEADGAMMICMRREEKVLPASLVHELVADEVFKVEQETGRSVGRKEKRDIKEQVLQQLLPRALVRSQATYAAILPKQGWLLVDAASVSKAEAVIELLNKTLGALHVVVPNTDESPQSAMTRWLCHDQSLPAGFSLGDECELHAGEGAEGIVRCKYIDLGSDEIRAHVAAGRSVKKLAMDWQERISFLLQDDLSLKRLRFDSAIVEEAEASGDDEVSRFDADFVLMVAELGALIPDLLAALNSDCTEV